MHKYSVVNLIQEYNKNKHIIQAHFRKEPIEGYNRSNNKTTDSIIIAGMALGTFLLVLAFSLGLLVWAVWATITYWDKLNNTAHVFVVLSWFFMPPILPLIIVYVAKSP